MNKEKINYTFVWSLVVFSFVSVFYRFIYLPRSIGGIDIFEFVFVLLPILIAILYLSVEFIKDIRTSKPLRKDGKK